MDAADTDHQSDDDVRHRQWEADLYDRIAPAADEPSAPLTPDQERQQRAFARLLTFARDYGRGLLDEEYLRRECFALLIELKTSALIEGVEIGLSLGKGDPEPTQWGDD